ncbi:GTPase [Lignipirellula cremea]|uniref:tRNA modification GTPase MnmE n=1 Tax=Lignipirellula cremea TaxID=2528010 RepID=A0A518E099_9BACT|nr:GTPase [Lignipirellula cremea]QDU97499.1 tRNA modification GTPase MnmE [Lignipirellula cremea]
MILPPPGIAELTPAGRGAVAVIAVTGPQAATAVAACFRSATGRSLENALPGQMLFGRWQPVKASREATELDAGEEVIVARFPQRIEVHCHGGRAAVQAILASLRQQGGVDQTAAAAMAQDAPNPFAADSLQALSQARTERTAAILLDQHRGALHAALLELGRVLPRSPELALEQLDRLLDQRGAGLHLTTPWQVVLAGAPNVGKSSLINAILGYDRAIVFDQPGTTRDVLTGHTAIDGWPVELADTAGIRWAADDDIEQQGVGRAMARVEQADLLIHVIDATDPAASTAAALTHPHRLTVYNKADLIASDLSNAEAPNDKQRQPIAPGGAGRLVSAKTGAGLPELLATIATMLVPKPPPPGSAVPFLAAHFTVLTEARQLAAAGNGTTAAEQIERLLSGDKNPGD